MSVVLSASRVLQRPSLSVFIGREKEFAELQRRLNAALSGDCQFAVVAGEPGIGKTRLLEELKNLAIARKIRVLYGRFVEQDRSFSYQGFCELIQDYFRTRDPAASSGDRPDFSDLAADLIALFPQLSEIGDLRAAVSGDSRIAAPVEEKKVEDRIQIFELLARTLTRIAGGKPLVLILENLHGAEISIEALQYIVRRLGPTPTLIVGSYRQTETDKRHPLTRMLDSFVDDPRFVSLTLPPFSPSEHRTLVESLVGAPKVSDDLAQRLRDATEGNPFFTKELIRSLVESGGIARDDTGAWSFSKEAEISADALPATIQQAVEKRIERLPEELKDLLSIASVLGKTFDSRDLDTLTEDAKGVEDAIDRLILEGILEEERESRGDRLTFASGIVRDVLYGALSRRRRRSLHRKYAELIEKRATGRLERVYPELVHHFWQGDVPEKTVEYGLKLAQKSLDTFSPEDAIRVAKITLEFLEDEEWAGDPALEGEARLMLAQGQRMSGNVEGALREAEAAMRVFEERKSVGRAVAAVLFAAESAWQARRIDDARRWVERGIETARAAGEPDPLSKLLSLGATVANLRGEYAKAAGYQEEIERLIPREKAAEEEIPRGGTLVVAMANPIAAVEPGVYETTEEHEVLANAYETLVTTDAQGNLAPQLAERWALEDDARMVRVNLRPGVVFSDGSPLTAVAVKASLERSIRLSRNAMPTAFAVMQGAAEFAGGKSDEVSGLTARSDRELEIRLVDSVPIFPVPADRRQDCNRARRRRRRRAIAEAPRHGPLPDRRSHARAGRPRAQPAVVETATPADRARRVPRLPLGSSHRPGIPLRATRRRPGPPAAGPRRDSPRPALPGGPRRDPAQEHLLRGVPPRQRRRRQCVAAARPRERRADPGLRLGGAGPICPAGNRPDPPRDPRARSGKAAAAPSSRQGSGARPCLRPETARPAARLGPSHPAQPVRGADAGPLPDLERARCRGRDRDEDHARVSRVLARERGHRRDARPLDRGLRRPGQLHVFALPLLQRPHARLLFVARDRPGARGGPARESTRPPGKRSTANSSTSCSTPPPSCRSSTTWTTASDARTSGAFNCAVRPPTSATRNSARPTRRPPRPRRTARRAAEFCTSRSRASYEASIPRSPSPWSRPTSCRACSRR